MKVIRIVGFRQYTHMSSLIKLDYSPVEIVQPEAGLRPVRAEGGLNEKTLITSSNFLALYVLNLRACCHVYMGSGSPKEPRIEMFEDLQLPLRVQ